MGTTMRLPKSSQRCALAEALPCLRHVIVLRERLPWLPAAFVTSNPGCR
jgi:hypothetical protein